MMLKPLLHIFLFDALFVDKTFCVSGLKLRNFNWSDKEKNNNNTEESLDRH